MKAIYKYELKLEEYQVINMQHDAVVLSVQIQDGKIFIWALVDNSKSLDGNRSFNIYGTGQEISRLENWTLEQIIYIGTVQLGSFVWHVFEDTAPF